jgi:serine/threonine-protein kinase TTK/MPS1
MKDVDEDIAEQINKRHYNRLDLIGKGGSSKVYRIMTERHELFALKRISLDKTDTETMNGYMNEIALLKRLEGNKRIIRLIDSEAKAGAGTSKGYLHLVMECGEIGECDTMLVSEMIRLIRIRVDFARLLQEQQSQPMNMVWIAYYWQQVSPTGLHGSTLASYVSFLS